VVMLERTWHIAGLYVILCFSGSVVHAVSSVTTLMWNERFAQVAAYWKGVTLGKNELALYYYAN
jgi:hypothetical protein